MDSMRRWMLAGAMCLGGFSTMYMGGCVIHPHHEEWVDNHGYHHQGYYDDQHAWHGGYSDEQGVHHDDPPDWHH
jgi:hypothetical protein